jgi:2-methylisocitrate lyase-like PEP mutase family enzyme
MPKRRNGVGFRDRHALDERHATERTVNRPDQKSLALQFRDLNRRGGLLLPNAWDAASACVFEKAGFPAIGTTSAGIAYSRGWRDGQHIERAAMVREISVIANAVHVPVTADIEAGYGPRLADVTETVEAALDAGAIGVNLEDNTHGAREEPLYGVDEQAARIAAARAVADRRGIALVINARTDTFLAQVGADIEERTAATIERGRAYLKAGADLVFVPLVVDRVLVRRLADGIGGPVSLMVLPGAPSAEILFAAGARRISIGQTAMLAALGVIAEIADEMRQKGTWSSIERSFYGFGEAESLFDSH